MNKEELVKLKIKYEEKKKERSKLQRAKERIKELEKEPKVREYLGLIGVKDKKVLSDEEILLTIINSLPSNNLANIYIYIGAYCYDGTPYYGYTEKQDSNFYHFYINIEQESKRELVLQNDRENFKKNKIIISFTSDIHAMQFYHKIQQFYFTQLINGNNEEETLEKIKTKSKEFKIKEIVQK